MADDVQVKPFLLLDESQYYNRDYPSHFVYTSIKRGSTFSGDLASIGKAREKYGIIDVICVSPLVSYGVTFETEEQKIKYQMLL